MILILLSLMMILTACTSSTEINSIKNRVNKSGLDQLTITGVHAFMVSRDVYDEEERQNWQKFIYDKYGVNIKTSPNIGDIPGDIVLGNVDGIACVYSNSSFVKLIKSGSILPLDEYLKDNKAWNSLPEEFKKSYQYDGQTWGISSTSVTKKIVLMLYINNAWLKKADMPIPTTLAELYEFGLYCTKHDMDDDGIIGNDYLLDGVYLQDIQQICQAFGIYYPGGSAFGYDPTMGCIVNCLFKPEALELLKYLQSLCKAGMVSFNSPSYSKETGLICGQEPTEAYLARIQYAIAEYEKEGRTFDQIKQEDYEYAISKYQALPPLEGQYPLAYSKYGVKPVYVLTSKNEKPKETINLFADLLFGSKESYLDFALGGHWKNTGGSEYYIEYKNAEAKTFYEQPLLAYYDDMIMGKDFVTTTIDYDWKKLLKPKYDRYQMNQRFYEQYAERLVALPDIGEVSGETYEQMRKIMTNDYIALMDAVTDPKGNVEKALEFYRETLKREGVADVLKEANQALGFPNKQVIQ